MMPASGQHKVPPFWPLLETKVRRPSTSTRAPVGVVGPSTTHKGPGYQVTGRQSSVWAMEPAGACQLASDPIGHSLGATREHGLG